MLSKAFRTTKKHIYILLNTAYWSRRSLSLSLYALVHDFFLRQLQSSFAFTVELRKKSNKPNRRRLPTKSSELVRLKELICKLNGGEVFMLYQAAVSCVFAWHRQIIFIWVSEKASIVSHLNVPEVADFLGASVT